MGGSIEVTFAEFADLKRAADEQTMGRIDDDEYVRRVRIILGPERSAIVEAARVIGNSTIVKAI